MSTKIKLFLYIIASSIAAFVGIILFLSETDRYAETFVATAPAPGQKGGLTEQYMKEKAKKKKKKTLTKEEQKRLQEATEAHADPNRLVASGPRKEIEQQNPTERLSTADISTAQKSETEDALVANAESTKQTAEKERADSDADMTAQAKKEEEVPTGKALDKLVDQTDVAALAPLDDKEQALEQYRTNTPIQPQDEVNAEQKADTPDPKPSELSGKNKSALSLNSEQGSASQATSKQKAKTVKALDLAFVGPPNAACSATDGVPVQVGIHYRPSSYAIKGRSLTDIDSLVRLYSDCDGGKFLLLQTEAGLDNTTERLVGLRADEVKYYLLQSRVQKDDIIFSEKQ